MKVLTDWLAANKESLDALRQGAQKHYYWPIYDKTEKGPAWGTPAETMKLLSQYSTVISLH